jgi:RNA polymerase sigma factor (TIGR02999 family)
MADVTALLARWRKGDRAALDELMPLVYAELRKLAVSHLRRERGDHTLQPTALVHEAYLRLASVRDGGFDDRVHFFGAAANAMRRILVDHARGKKAQKRGGNAPLLDLDAALQTGIDPRLDLVALDDALQRLAALSPAKEKVVELRYFGGLSVEETAQVLGIAPATVKRHWSFARVWLYRALAGSDQNVP